MNYKYLFLLCGFSVFLCSCAKKEKMGVDVLPVVSTVEVDTQDERDTDVTEITGKEIYIEVKEASSLVGDWYLDENGIEWCDIYVEVGNISKEECAYFTEFFQKNNGGGFLQCDYDKPQDVDLGTVFYGAVTGEYDEKELEEIGWDYGYTDKSVIDETLLKFLGLTNEQMTIPLFVKTVEGKEVITWMHSDWVHSIPTCLGGYKEGDTYTLLMYAPFSVVTLVKNDNDTLAIISNRTLASNFDYADTDYNPNETYDSKTLSAYTKNDLELLRNEYYARHGMIFDDPVMKLYFEAMSWYEPSVGRDTFDESVFNSVEKENIVFIDELLNIEPENWN